MATRIRLRRVGRKGQSYFRIVVADSRSPRDGRFVATLGNYNPRTNPARIQVDAEQTRAWLEKGALPTDTVRSLLKQRSEEHTSELQSLAYLVCRLLLEKKKNKDSSFRPATVPGFGGRSSGCVS